MQENCSLHFKHKLCLLKNLNIWKYLNPLVYVMIMQILKLAVVLRKLKLKSKLKKSTTPIGQLNEFGLIMYNF